MKSASSELIAYINQGRAETDSRLCLANCFLFTLLDGTQLAYCDKDYPVVLNNITYVANSLQISGLKFKCTIGVDADKQQIVIAATSSDVFIGTQPAMKAIAGGILDGCEIRRDLMFLTQELGSFIGSALLFKGRCGEVDQVGRTQAKVTVNSDLILLDLMMPRNLYAPGCQHVLYDAGCGLAASSFETAGVVGAGSSDVTILWSDANANFAQGKIVFTSGVNGGLFATVKSTDVGRLYLAYPMDATPAEGDTFNIYYGCDHSMATCQSKFDNRGNFRGFPFIPPPVFAA